MEYRRSVARFSLGLLGLLVSLGLASALRADEPPASRFLPPEPWLVVELRGAPRALRALEAHPGWQRAWAAAIALDPADGAGLAKLAPARSALERARGMAALPALGDLLGERALFWVEGPEQWLAAIEPGEPQLVARFLLELDRALEWIPGAPDLEAFEHEGRPGWSIGASFHVLRAEECFLIGPSRALVERALQRAVSASAPAPVETRAAERAAGATLWIAGALVSRSDGVASSRNQLREPAAHLLLGSYLAPLLEERALRVDLRWSEDLAQLRFEAEAGDARSLESYWRALVAPAQPSFAVPSFERAPGFLARVRLQRDWARWWREKDARWSETGRAGIRELEQLLALLMKGEDFADALADVEGPLELFFVEPRFEEGRAPAHRYPAGALVIGLARAERGEIFERAFRTLVGISNGERVKRGFSTLRSSASEEGGFRIVRTAWEEDAPELQRVEGNLSPAFARCAHHVVIASSAQALDAALEVLRSTLHGGAAASDGDAPAAAAPVCEVLALDGRALSRLLEANREALVFARALDEGEELANAERRIEALLELARVLSRAELRLALGEERVRATLEIELAEVPR